MMPKEPAISSCQQATPVSRVSRGLYSPSEAPDPSADSHLEVCEITGAQLLDGDGLVIKLTIFDGIIVSSQS